MSVSCPDCGSDAFKRNGYTRHGKQNHRCLDCGRQFSLEIQELIQKDNQQNFSSISKVDVTEPSLAQIIIN